MVKLGALQSPPDPRDYIYSQMVPLKAVPSKFLLPEFAVRDQGQYGTCVGQAAASIKDIHENIETSPLFVYSECKKIDGTPQEGTYPRVAFQVLKNLGICRESTFPYSLMTSSQPPDTTEAAKEEAKEFVIGAYARINTIDEIKNAILNSGPVMAALFLCENFLEPEKDGFIALPEGAMLGGHAVVVTGWNDHLTNGKHTGYFRIRNSWGKSWGDNGYCWVPYDYFNFVTDIGMRFWLESWSCVDVVLPPENARRIIIVPGSATAIVDGQEVTLDQPAFITENNRTVVPLRFIAENMGWAVHWDGRQVIMTK